MENFPAWVIDWDLDQSERGIDALIAFLASAGVKFEPSADQRKMLEAIRQSKASARHSPRELFEEHLAVAANKALEQAGDARRLFRDAGGARRWLLLTPDQLSSARAAGLKLERAGGAFRRAMWSLATVPVALGTYFLAMRLLRERGVDEWVAWALALGAWFAVRQLLNRTLLRAR